MRSRFLAVWFAVLVAASAGADATSPCSSRRAHLVYPPDDSTTITSPVLFAWTPVRNAVGYNVFLSLNGAAAVMIGSTVTDREYLVAPLPLGNADWYVETLFAGCPSTRSDHTQFAVISPPCTTPSKTVAAVVRTVTTGVDYTVRWRPVPGSSQYRLEESGTPDFSTPVVYDNVAGASEVIQHDAAAATPYYYRVQAIADCNQSRGPFSSPVHVVVIPKPPQTHTRPQLVAQAGAKRGINHNVFISGKGSSGTTTYVVTADKPWITVTPSSGTLPPSGVVVSVAVDPTTLDAGNHTATLSVTTTSTPTATTHRTSENAVSISSTAPATTIPVSISLVTPVNPTVRPGPATSTIVIPAVSHANGVDSLWQSDIRLANPSLFPQTYQISFTPSGTDVSSTEIHQTNVEIDPGDTTAIDDIVNNWYGFGALNDGVNGALQITPIDNKGNPLTVLPRLVAIASSRTYDVTPNGSLGQYIPAIPLSSFVAQSLDQTKPARLSLQQIAESADFRTNVGFLEGSGQPASLLINIFDSAGHVLKSNISVALAAGEHKQLNSFLAQQGISNLTDGRMEISVVSPTGKVTAYASVVDNHSSDPLVVTAVQPTAVSANRYTIPGVADLNNGSLHWRTDLRVFNPLPTAVSASATFYPITAADSPLIGMTQSLSIGPGEVKRLDDVLNATFGRTNIGGAIQITTVAATPLVVTARTYDRDASGATYGQFVPGVTAADGAGSTDAGLQLLQIEESDAFHTNVGLAEVSGNPVTVQISAVVPDSRVTPIVQLSLRANEFMQLNQIMKSFGFPTAYNARVIVQAISGSGRITAYASVVDNKSSDPTYVPAQ